MKKNILLLIITTSFSYAQNPTKFISFDRTYYNNSLLNAYTDKLKTEYDFKGNYTVASNISVLNLNLLNTNNYDDESIRELYSIDLSLNKKIIFKKKWTVDFQVAPQIRSNFSSGINADDFIINAHIKAEKEFSDKSSLFVTTKYGTLFGKSQLYLEFGYSHSISKKLNFSVGFPKTTVEYCLNSIHSLSLESAYDGYYTTTSQNSFSRVLENEILNYKTLYFSKIQTALHYNYKFYDHSIVDFSIGKSFQNQLEIKESNNQITKVKFNNNFTVSMGFKYNLNFK